MNNFFSELSRRNVFRVAAAYVIVGWIVLQVVGLLAPSLGLPDWTLALIFVFLLSAFPVALFLTWAFEMTPDGVQKTAAPDAPAATGSQRTDFGLIAVAIVLIGVTVFVPRGPGPMPAPEEVVAEPTVEPPILVEAAPATSEASIAVLAFANMSGDPENEYFSDGISEEILNALAGIKSMRVAARTSAFSFKGKNEDIREIGKTLDVAHVLEGSVRRAGNRVRVTAQLINVSNGYHLWSSTYDRELTDIFAIQEEIALAITRALKIELNLEEEGLIAHQGTENIEAYNIYLKAKQVILIDELSGSLTAIDLYKQALALDPEFSDAWGELAMVYARSHVFQPFAHIEKDFEEAFTQALALNPDDPGGLAGKAYFTVITTHDWREAGELYRRAIEIDPSGWVVGLYTGYYLYPLGRNSETNAVYRKALRRDPLNSELRREFTFFNSFEGTPNEIALAQIDQLSGDMKSSTNAVCLKAKVLALLGRDAEARETLPQLTPEPAPWNLAICALAHFHLQDQQKYEALLAKLESPPANAYGYAQPLASVYAEAGEVEAWLDQMDKSLAIQEFGTSFVRGATAFLQFEGDHDRRYQKLLKAVRLDDASLAEMGMTWGGRANR